MEFDDFDTRFPLFRAAVFQQNVDWEEVLELDAVAEKVYKKMYYDEFDLKNSGSRMDQQPPSASATPNLAQMHLQQQRPDMLGSPALGSQPMTPQQQQQMMQASAAQQFSHEYQQQQFQPVPPSPSSAGVPQQHMQAAMGADSPGMFNRQMMPQAMMQQQQLQQQQQMQQQQQLQQQQMMSQQAGAMGGMPPQYPGYPTAQQQQQQQWAQQQQQMAAQQQAHFARQPQMMGNQPGQQVMVRRVGVPYPPGTGYPQGMQQQTVPGQAPPGAQFPPRPVVQGPPPQMQRPVYPTGTNAPPPQYPQYPPAQAGYPQAAFQQQMYPGRPPQVAQQMRPYISPQSGMVPPQGVYGNNPGPQPQTPQTPQPPFTPNGTRFPQPTPSPHYGAADIRSPPLMSPNQQQMQAAAQRPMSNGDMVNPPMRMPVVPPAPVHVNHLASNFYAHDPNVAANITADNCLVGCCIHVFDVDRFSSDKTDLANLGLAVRLRGGDIDFGLKTYPERAPLVTHVVCESYRSQHVQMALKERKRVVTLQWLCDVLQQGKMDIPTKLAHLPSYHPMNEPRPMTGKFFSLSGYDETERAAIKWMIESLGGRMTPHLSRHNNVLVAKHLEAEKVEKAREWEIQIYNYQWVADTYIAGRHVEGDPVRYQPGNTMSEVVTTPYVLEMMHEASKHMMAAWRQPVIVQPEQWQKAVDLRRALSHDDTIFPNKKYQVGQTPAPSEEDVLKVEQERKERGVEQVVAVAFCGVDDEVKTNLSRKLRFLGGKVVENVTECTHLVAVQGSRSERLLEAIALGKNVVQPYWIIHGYECRQFMDTFDYFLRDEESEKHLGYSCKRSVLRARSRPVFEDVTFYITSSVEPSRATLTRLIHLAGGKVDEQRPAPAMLANCIETDALYVVISCDADMKTVNYLLECGYPVYSVEFVLMALLRQEMQPHHNYRLFFPRLVRQAARPQPVHQEAPRVRV